MKFRTLHVGKMIRQTALELCTDQIKNSVAKINTIFLHKVTIRNKLRNIQLLRGMLRKQSSGIAIAFRES